MYYVKSWWLTNSTQRVKIETKEIVYAKSWWLAVIRNAINIGIKETVC